MQLRRSLLALVALAITAPSLPALAAEGDADGCRDITYAEVRYYPNRERDEGLTIGEIDVDDGDDTWVYDGGGRLLVDELTLAAPACRTVTYTVYLYADTLGSDGQPVLLGARSLTGEGPRPTVLGYDTATDPDSPISGAYAEPCVRVVLETASARTGTVFDRAADDNDEVDYAYRRVCGPTEVRTWN